MSSNMSVQLEHGANWVGHETTQRVLPKPYDASNTVQAVVCLEHLWCVSNVCMFILYIVYMCFYVCYRQMCVVFFRVVLISPLAGAEAGPLHSKGEYDQYQ